MNTKPAPEESSMASSWCRRLLVVFGLVLLPPLLSAQETRSATHVIVDAAAKALAQPDGAVLVVDVESVTSNLKGKRAYSYGISVVEVIKPFGDGKGTYVTPTIISEEPPGTEPLL